MTENESKPSQTGAINASWDRCEHKHRLARNALHPILRLQSAEVRPRSEELVERTGGRLGIFKKVADIAVGAGYCFSVADADGVLVRREGKVAQQSQYESNGIALGSCWDERIAGTNGVSMALAQRSAFTVRGQEHYFSKLKPFACTGVPLHDAENKVIGVVNLATVDKGNAADYLYARQLLGLASDRIQRVLFERQFSGSMLVNVSSIAGGDLLRNNALLAVDEDGLILGSTSAAHALIGLAAPMDLVGQSFEHLFGADAFALDRIPEHAPHVRTDHGKIVRLSRRMTDTKSFSGRGWQPTAKSSLISPTDHPQSSAQPIAMGDFGIADLVNRARAYLDRAIPFIVQGESGTGKTALLTGLLGSPGAADREVITIDCALLDDGEQDRSYVKTIFQQARIVSLLGSDGNDHLALVLDNVDELPDFAQAALRNLLQEREDKPGTNGSGVAVVATSRKNLNKVVQSGGFRDDLYYLLANTVIAIPPVRARKDIATLANAIASRSAGNAVEIAPETMGAIRSFYWPGNVRQLKSTLLQALLEGDGQRISLIDLKCSPIFDSDAGELANEPAVVMRPLFASYNEKEQVLDALRSTKWNVSQAARRLGIGRATIHRKMKQFNITRPS